MTISNQQNNWCVNFYKHTFLTKNLWNNEISRALLWGIKSAIERWFSDLFLQCCIVDCLVNPHTLFRLYVVGYGTTIDDIFLYAWNGFWRIYNNRPYSCYVTGLSNFQIFTFHNKIMWWWFSGGRTHCWLIGQFLGNILINYIMIWTDVDCLFIFVILRSCDYWKSSLY